MRKLKIIPNPSKNKYNEMTDAVNECEGFCPCLIDKNEDTKCICKEFREQSTEGECHCGRFIKIFVETT